MNNLHVLEVVQCQKFHPVIRVLDLNMHSLNFPICPGLEELVIRTDRMDISDIERVVRMTATRESGGEKLRSVRVVNLEDFVSCRNSETTSRVWNITLGMLMRSMRKAMTVTRETEGEWHWRRFRVPWLVNRCLCHGLGAVGGRRIRYRLPP